MSEERRRRVAEVIAAKRVSMSLDEARDLAEVEIVATYKLANVNRKALEALLHNFSAALVWISN